MTLAEIRVRGLFGRFDHKIVLPKTERVTIMIAPNGFGKTMILRIVNIVFNQGLLALRRLPFRELNLRFDDGSTLTVTRTDSADPTDPESLPEMQVTFTRDGVESACTSLDFSYDDRRFPLGMIEEWIPTLDRVGARAWADVQTGQRLSLQEVLEQCGHQLPTDLQVELGTPEWLSEVQQRVPIRFVDAERLTRPLADHGFRRSRRHSRPTERTVDLYSRELAHAIQQTLTEYGSLSQSLDRTFPTRLVSQALQADVTMDELRDELAQVERKRRQLVEAGLLKQEHEGLNAPVPDIEDVEESRREVLAMFADDSKKKLSVFDGILAKVDTLKRIANRRFLHKEVTVGHNGIVVTAAEGLPLDLAMLSSGEQHELVLLYDLLFGVSEDTLIMIDEPELSLHVAWQEKFLSDIEEIAKLANFRVLLATHSPQIIGDRYDLAVELGGPVEIAAPAAR